jgi:hypothetical protein
MLRGHDLTFNLGVYAFRKPTLVAAVTAAVTAMVGAIVSAAAVSAIVKAAAIAWLSSATPRPFW